MPAVFRTPRADADLEAIGDYIGEQSGSPSIAEKFLAELAATMEAYARQPLMGERRDDLGEALRSFSFKRNYIVIYQPLDDGIVVLRIFHAARDYLKLFHSGE
jgi:toxin ParE1/3/4